MACNENREVFAAPPCGKFQVSKQKKSARTTSYS